MRSSPRFPERTLPLRAAGFSLLYIFILFPLPPNIFSSARSLSCRARHRAGCSERPKMSSRFSHLPETLTNAGSTALPQAWRRGFPTTSPRHSRGFSPFFAPRIRAAASEPRKKKTHLDTGLRRPTHRRRPGLHDFSEKSATPRRRNFASTPKKKRNYPAPAMTLGKTPSFTVSPYFRIFVHAPLRKTKASP